MKTKNQHEESESHLKEIPGGLGGSPTPEKFYTIKTAAALLGLHYWHLQRAIKRGLVPSHRLLTTKRLVRLSEVIAAIERSAAGGHDE